MTTTNFNHIPELQELSDQDLEQVTGGFRLFRWIKGLFRFGKKKVVKDQNYWHNYHNKRPHHGMWEY
jgi:bacteriocin-like protein